MAQGKLQIQESTLYPEIIQYLRNEGFNAIGETKIEGNKRPDIIFEFEGMSFIVEVKLDDKEVAMDAVLQVSGYAEKLKTENYIVLIFPKVLKNQSISLQQINQIVLDTPIYAALFTNIWRAKIEGIKITDLFQELKNKLIRKEITIDFNSVVEDVNKCIVDLTFAIQKINQQALATEIVDKLDLFAAIGDFKDKESAYKQVINLASFLFFNQVLFYHIFHKKTKDKVSELVSIAHIKEVQKYFDEIQYVDYKSIYKVNILGHIPNEAFFIQKINELIIKVKSLRAEYITHDLAGRFFHELIPHEVRKVLAAFYTHPNAADLLAGLLIESYEDTTIDPACGSGTLLVAAYKRKQWLYEKMFGYANQAQMHKSFIENDITGIDIMPFAAHISTINLTMQNIEQVTNTVRFATRDSLELANPLNRERVTDFGIDIEGYNETIQGTIFKIYESKKVKKGAINPEGESAGFKLTLSDVVIMNPPYSDREKMPKSWQDKLNQNITLNKHSGNLVNLWGYFLVLGDLLVKENGLMGSVIPINFARGQASEKIREFTFKNHTVRYIIKPVGDLAFSEGAAFRDILLITEKKKPEAEDTCKIVYFKKSIREFQNEQMPQLYNQIRKAENASNETFDVFTVMQSELWEKQNNLMHFLWASSLKSYKILNEFYKKLNTNKLMNFPESFVKDCFNSSGFNGLIDATFITNPFDESRTKQAFMILEGEDENFVRIKLKTKKDSNLFHYKIPKALCKKALRTLTGIRTMQVLDKHDYWVSAHFEDFEDIFANLQTKKQKMKKAFDWEKVQKKSKEKFVNLVFSRRFRLNSANTSFVAFFSEEPYIQADVFKIIPNISIEKAKILCLFYNSSINIAQVLTNQEATTGGFGSIRETDLLGFQLLDYEKLTDKDREKLLDIFEKWSSVEFPSIVAQIEKRFEGRVAIDRAILEVLGYKKGEINEILPELYDTVLRELQQDF
jgi:Holliday junction resolvase